MAGTTVTLFLEGMGRAIGGGDSEGWSRLGQENHTGRGNRGLAQGNWCARNSGEQHRIGVVHSWCMCWVRGACGAEAISRIYREGLQFLTTLDFPW